MSESPVDVQQAIAISPTPAAEFQQPPRDRQREVFFRLPDTVVRNDLPASTQTGSVLAGKSLRTTV